MRLAKIHHNISIVLTVFPLLVWGQGGYQPSSPQPSTEPDPPVDIVQRRFKTSVIAGLNASQIDGDNMIGFNKPGINTGLRGVAQLSTRWDIGFELLYSQEGSSSRFDFTGNSSLWRYTLNYIRVPVMLFFSDWRVQGNIGLSYARALGVQIIEDGNINLAATDSYRPDDIGVVVGGTYYFTQHWGINVNWSRSLRSITLPGQTWQVHRGLCFRLLYTL
jgi:hypothetical protein